MTQKSEQLIEVKIPGKYMLTLRIDRPRTTGWRKLMWAVLRSEKYKVISRKIFALLMCHQVRSEMTCKRLRLTRCLSEVSDSRPQRAIKAATVDGGTYLSGLVQSECSCRCNILLNSSPLPAPPLPQKQNCREVTHPPASTWLQFREFRCGMWRHIALFPSRNTTKALQ